MFYLDCFYFKYFLFIIKIELLFINLQTQTPSFFGISVLVQWQYKGQLFILEMYNITLNIFITQYKWDFIQENIAVFIFQEVGSSYLGIKEFQILYTKR